MHHPDYILRLQKLTGKKLVRLASAEAWATPNSYYAHEKGHLTTLNLEGCFLRSFVIGPELARVTFLSLARNKVEAVRFDPQVEAFELIYLDVSYNQVSLEKMVIPGLKLKELKYLYLFQAKLKEITFQDPLVSLDTLHLAENKLTSINLPGSWEKLVTLYLHNNQLEDFSIDPQYFPAMEYLSLKDNPLTKSSLGKELFAENNCWDLVKGSLKASVISGDMLNNEAKLIFFGDSGAGKTTLSHHLRYGEFDPNIESTHGILVDPWTIDQKDFPQSLIDKFQKTISEYKKEKKKDIKMPEQVVLNIWDFGGQEYYHATHRLFISTNALYAIIWVTSDKLDYWRDNIQHYVGKEKKALILEIQNKASTQGAVNYVEGKYKIADRDVNKRLYEVEFDEFKKGLLLKTKDYEYLGRRRPKVYLDIRDAIVKERKNRKFFKRENFDEFWQKIDVNEAIKEEGSNSLYTFLTETGIIIYYDDQDFGPHLSEYVFIDPKWVTNFIYEILDKRLIKGLEDPKTKIIYPGEFDQEYFREKLKGNGISLEYEQLWIELLKYFKIIFEISRKGITKYAVPQYLPDKWTNLEAYDVYDPDTTIEVFTLYYPKFLPYHVIMSFISNYGSKHKNFKFYKYGLIFIEKNGSKTTTVKMTADVNQKSIKIEVSVTDAFLINSLFKELYNADKTDDLEIEIPKYKGIRVNYSLLMKWCEAKMETQLINNHLISINEFSLFINDYVSFDRADVPLKKYFDFQKDDNNDNFEPLAHLKTKKLVTDNEDMSNKKINTIFICYAAKDKKLKDYLVDSLRGHLGVDLWTDSEIVIGTKWREEIERAIKDAHAAILMVDSFFQASTYIQKTELPQFLKEMEERNFKIFPILTRKFDVSNCGLNESQFFSITYDYFGDKVIDASKRIPLDEVIKGNTEKRTSRLNNYCYKLASEINRAFLKK